MVATLEMLLKDQTDFLDFLQRKIVVYADLPAAKEFMIGRYEEMVDELAIHYPVTAKYYHLWLKDHL
jgi:hypothetical protein